MKPAPFEYYAPESTHDVIDILSSSDGRAKIIAGGQSLVPMLNLRLARFDALVDLRRVDELREVRVDSDGLRLGAAVCQCEIEERVDIGAAAPLLKLATPMIGHFQIRSRGTVGGSIAHADPAAEYPAVAIALDAEMAAVGPRGSRTIPANEFFTGTWSTELADDEVLTSIWFPAWPSGSRFAVEEVARRHGDFAIAGACVAVHAVDGMIERAAIALFGMGDRPYRATAAEDALVGSNVAGLAVGDVARAAVADLDPPADLHASSALRRQIGVAVVERAITRSLAAPPSTEGPLDA